MHLQDRIATLEREVRRLRVVALLCVVCVSALLLAGAVDAPADARFGTLDVERINVREPDGTPRLVIASSARFPGPMKQGKEADPGNRKVAPAGIVLLSTDGSEAGGLAVSEDARGKLSALLFDYDMAPVTTEATGIYRRIGTDGSAFSAWMIQDPPPADAAPATVWETDRSRIKLQNPGQDAEVLLTDTGANERIRLRVTKAGDAYIEILDADGQVVFRAPEKR